MNATLLQILHIEDSPDDNFMIKRQLRKGGLNSHTTRVFDIDALREALRKQEYDVVLSDHNLPTMDSFAALQIVRREFELDLPFIIVSGQIGESAAVAVMKAGANDFVSKDNPSRLVPAIERELKEAEIRRQKRIADAELLQAKQQLNEAMKIITEARNFIARMEGQQCALPEMSFEKAQEPSGGDNHGLSCPVPRKPAPAFSPERSSYAL